MALHAFAFVVFAVLIGAFVTAIVYLGSLPANIARRRGHPQVDAVNAASWIGIATFGVLWPLAFVWAFLDASSSAGKSKEGTTKSDLEELNARVAALEAALKDRQATSKRDNV